MALKHGILVFTACMFSFWVGVYINSLHDVVLDGPTRLRSIGRNFMDRVSGAGSSPVIPPIPPPQHISSYNLPSGHGPLVRLTEKLSFITGAPAPLPFASPQLTRPFSRPAQAQRAAAALRPALPPDCAAVLVIFSSSTTARFLPLPSALRCPAP
jgi:hypothetical protein